MTDRIARSVAFTIDVDQALNDLAATEGTSRADLVRQGITLMFRSRGIDLDATEGIDTDRVSVTHQRNRRQSPPEDTVRREFTAWWADHRAAIIDRGHAADLADRVAATIIGQTRRDGRAYDVIESIVPGGWSGDQRACHRVNDVLVDLVTLGGITRGRRRNGVPYVAPAPWATDD